MTNITKKDLFLMFLRVIVWVSLLSYVIFLYTHKVDIVPTKPWNYDVVILAIVALISLMIILVWLFRICFKRPRLTMFLMGIFLILFAYYSGIVDYPKNSNMVYLRDILVVLWVLASTLGLTNLCVYDKCKKIEEKIKEEKMEIIEV